MSVIEVIKAGELGAHPIISNLVKMPKDNRSILRRLADLPQDERMAIIDDIIQKRYPDQGYEGIKYDWELNARPSQLIPFDLTQKWNVFNFCSGRGFGKGASLNTPIPVLEGWTTMGEIKIGDTVFDEQGKQCQVTDVTNVYIPDKAYRLYFSDGTTLDVCDQHQWVTWTHEERRAFNRKDRSIKWENSKFPDDWVNWKYNKLSNFGRKHITDNLIASVKADSLHLNQKELKLKYNLGFSVINKIVNNKYESKRHVKVTDIGPKIRTTQDIVNTFHYGKRNDLNHGIPNAKALLINDIELPLEPYLYGLFLGDGSKHDATITTHKEDYIFYKEYLEKKSFTVMPLKLGKKNGVILNSGSFRVEGLYRSLKAFDSINHKRVLNVYTRASENQRLELIKGLLDTDGTISTANGQIEFCNTDKSIFDLAYEILVSLGQKPTISEKIGKLYGVEKKLVYRLRFLPTRFDLFALTRKAKILASYSIGLRQQIRNHHRMIVKFEEIEPVPMKCITVDSQNSMYLIGKQMLPTHNTRSLNEWAINMAKNHAGIRICMIAPTASDVDKVMLKGDSGLLSISPPWFEPVYNPTYHRMTWPNGSTAEFFSAERPDRLRGPQFHVCGIEELTSWRFLQETYEMMEYGLRLGTDNRIVIATTPRNIEFYINILKDKRNWTYVSNTFENQDNLANTYIEKMVEKYAGTRLGRQELEAEILADDDKALWKRDWIDKNRVKIKYGYNGLPEVDEYGRFVPAENMPEFISIVVAIDPAVSVNKSSAETAVTVAAYGSDGKYYVLYADSAKDTPDGWAKRVYELYDEWLADCIVVETNQGGNLVVDNLKKSGRQAPIMEVRARRGKLLRAEPIAGLYERNQVRHYGKLDKCETQMCNFNQHFNKGLCDIVDSTVYALQALVDKVEGFIDGSLLYATGDPRESLMTFKVI